MLTLNTLFERELKKLIASAVEDRKDNLSTGLATIDFPTYKHQVGIIKGLRLALEVCDEAALAIERRERN